MALAVAFLSLLFASQEADMEKYRPFVSLPAIGTNIDFQAAALAGAMRRPRWLELDKKGSARTSTEEIEWLALGDWPQGTDLASKAKAALEKPDLTDAPKLCLLVLANRMDDASKLDETLPSSTEEEIAAHAAYANSVLVNAMIGSQPTEAHRIAMLAGGQDALAKAVKLLASIDTKPWAFSEPSCVALRLSAMLTQFAKPESGTYKVPYSAVRQALASSDDVAGANAAVFLVATALGGEIETTDERRTAMREAMLRMEAIRSKLPLVDRSLAVRVLALGYRTLEDKAAERKVMLTGIAEAPKNDPNREKLVLYVASIVDPKDAEPLVAETRSIGDSPMLRMTDAKLLFKLGRYVSVDDLLDRMTSEEERSWVETAHKAMALVRAKTTDEVSTLLEDVGSLANKQGEPKSATADRIYLVAVAYAMLGATDKAKEWVDGLRQWDVDYPRLEELSNVLSQ